MYKRQIQYDVIYREANTGNRYWIKTTSALQNNIPIPYGKTYEVRVKARRGSGPGVWSEAVTQTNPYTAPENEVPAQVTGFTATVNSNVEIALSWDSVPRVNSYIVSINGREITVNTTRHTFDDLQSGTTYRLKVRAVSPDSNNLFGYWSTILTRTTTSGQRSLAGIKVTGLNATALSNGNIAVAWNSVNNADSYQVEFWRTSSSRRTESAQSNSHTLRNLDQDVQYTCLLYTSPSPRD